MDDMRGLNGAKYSYGVHEGFADHCFLCSTKRTVCAAIARYRGASARREFGHANGPRRKERRASEIPPPRHARLDHTPRRRRPQASRSSPVDFSSRSTPVGAASHVATRSSPGDRVHAGLVHTNSSRRIVWCACQFLVIS